MSEERETVADLRPARVCAHAASGSSTANRETQRSFTRVLSSALKRSLGSHSRFPYFFAVSDFNCSLRDHVVAHHLPVMTAARAKELRSARAPVGDTYVRGQSKVSVPLQNNSFMSHTINPYMHWHSLWGETMWNIN